jgi:hypothetical protein
MKKRPSKAKKLTKFGDNLKIFKATHDLSYTEIAEKLDTAESTFTYYQRREDTNFILFLFYLREHGYDLNELFK